MRGDGYCECGCGEQTGISKYNDPRRDRVKGRPYRYVHGHNRRLSGVPYIVQSTGYSTPCWLWQRSLNDRGYGQIRVPGRSGAAHRVYWEDMNGRLPKELTLDHLCRNRSCVRPEHLEAVTHAENIRRGSRTILTRDQVNDILARVQNGAIQRRLAEEFGVTPSTINRIVKHKNWVAA